MKKILIVATLSATSLMLSACAPKLGGSDYSTRGVGEISQTFKGTIVSARPVMLNSSDEKLGAGAAIGGISGGLLGSTIGGGKGRLVTGVLGGLAGGAAGHLLEGKMSEQQGMEYQVQLDRGDVITLAQGEDPKMSVGQRVLVIQSGKDRSRVVPDGSAH
jgi:outer membrane lipoprotein SlyB